MRTVLNSSVDPLLGRLLDGRYEVSGRIAQGGMAVVYAAFDTRLDRPVAVKVMHPALAADEDFVARFRREAKAAAKLSNPHVVSVTDQGRDGDAIFLVMELVEGRTLREVLREAGRLSPAEALHIMVAVLEALAAAHRAGLIHRDVKPENVLVSDDGDVKVGDFGLARAVDASPLTATTGLLLGTVAYLAPEQVARGVADARADIYACGVMLFELLTGRPPYQGATPLQVAYQHLNDDVPAPSSVVPAIPKSVDRLVADATSRDPAGRPHDATAMLFRARAVLDRLEPDGVSGATPHHARHAHSAQGAHSATAPLEIDLETAEAAALELARRGRWASGRRPPEPLPAVAPPFSSSFVNGIDGIPSISIDGGEPFDRHLTEEGRVIPPAQSAPSRRKPRRAAAREAKVQKKAAAKQARRRRRFLRPGRIALVLLLALSVAAGLVGYQLAGRRSTVPSVMGTSPAAAQDALRTAHLTPQVAAVAVYSETVPKGQVAATDPGAGRRVKRGSHITVRLSLGPERYTVPSVASRSLTDAVSALKVAHLHPATPSQTYSDTVHAGSVISILPAAGTLAKPNTSIAIVVSMGPAPVVTPTLTDLSGDGAKAALEKAGLKVAIVQEYSTTVDAGIAIGIKPATGLHRMQAVTLTVSKGPQLVYIPGDIENDSPSHAQSYLEGIGLRVAKYSFPGLDSRILNVKPNAGSQVAVGSQVTIYLY